MSPGASEVRSVRDRYYRTAVTVFVGQMFAAAFLTFGAWYYAGISANAVSAQGVYLLRILVIALAVSAVGVKRAWHGTNRLKRVYQRSGEKGVLKSLQAGAVMLGMLALLVSVIGSLIVALSGVSSETYTFGGVSAILFFALFPGRGGWEKILTYLKQLQGVK